MAERRYYRALDPQHQANSPWFQEGYERGLADRGRLARGLDPRGMSPQRKNSVMYQQGYRKGLGTVGVPAQFRQGFKKISNPRQRSSG